MSLEYNKKIIPRAKELRKNATRHEKHLWYDFLSKYPMRFQRQKIIGSYIADFYCHKAKLIIELDGNQHFENDAIEYDAERTKFFNALGVKVLRFTNIEIDKNFKTVCEHIDNVVNNEVTHNDKL